MKRIDVQDQQKAVRILTCAFKNNPGVLWVIKKDQYIEKRLKALCEFCLSVSIQKEGAFLTSDHKGVVLIFQSTAKQHPLKWLSDYFKLGTYCIAWNRAWSMIQREREIISRRPKTPYLYLWMMAVNKSKNGLNSIIEIRDFIFDLSKTLKLPIYAETTVERNLPFYQRYGFEVYSEWKVSNKNISVWFIKREWNYSDSKVSQ